jgi:hypothetical protein
MKSIDLLESWLAEVDTDPDLQDCIVKYVRAQGGVAMLEIFLGMDSRYRLMAQDSDVIGWRWFMEGMVRQDSGRFR